MTEERPYTLVAELTYRCPLQCVYCSNPLDLGQHRQEIDAATWARVIGEAEELGVVQLNLTGGEPLVRADLETIAASGDHVFVLHRNKGTRKGKTIDEKSVLVFKLDKGAVTEVAEFRYDQPQEAQFWS